MPCLCFAGRAIRIRLPWLLPVQYGNRAFSGASDLTLRLFTQSQFALGLLLTCHPTMHRIHCPAGQSAYITIASIAHMCQASGGDENSFGGSLPQTLPCSQSQDVTIRVLQAHCSRMLPSLACLPVLSALPPSESDLKHFGGFCA